MNNRTYGLNIFKRVRKGGALYQGKCQKIFMCVRKFPDFQFSYGFDRNTTEDRTCKLSQGAQTFWAAVLVKCSVLLPGCNVPGSTIVIGRPTIVLLRPQTTNTCLKPSTSTSWVLRVQIRRRYMRRHAFPTKASSYPCMT